MRSYLLKWVLAVLLPSLCIACVFSTAEAMHERSQQSPERYDDGQGGSWPESALNGVAEVSAGPGPATKLGHLGDTRLLLADGRGKGRPAISVTVEDAVRGRARFSLDR